MHKYQIYLIPLRIQRRLQCKVIFLRNMNQIQKILGYQIQTFASQRMILNQLLSQDTIPIGEYMSQILASQLTACTSNKEYN